MRCKTGADHIQSLKDRRTIYIDGALVGDVTTHPAFRNTVASAARFYDFQSQSENLERMTFSRAQFHDTPGHVFQNYQAQIRLSVKLRFLVGLAHKITEAIGTTNMPQVREQLGALAANAGMVEAMVAGMEASGAQRGEFYLPNRHMLYAAHVTTQELYPRMINLIRDLAGGALIMLPSSFRDWANPQLAPILHRTQRSANFDPQAKVKLLKAAWDALGSEFASRHVQYEMFYAGARFVTAGHSYRTYDWEAARGMVDKLLSTFDLETPPSEAV